MKGRFEPFDQTRLGMLWGATVVSTAARGEISVQISEETSARILAMLKTEPKLTAKDLAARLDLTSRAIELKLAILKAEGQLVRVAPNKGGHWDVLK